jgi:methylenetetrahydrofolate reductase (NADPH)
MLILRRWSVRRAAALGRLYRWGARWLPRLAPLVRGLGPERSEGWLRPLERSGKGCCSTAACAASACWATGMACPMNCAKQHAQRPLRRRARRRRLRGAARACAASGWRPPPAKPPSPPADGSALRPGCRRWTAPRRAVDLDPGDRTRSAAPEDEPAPAATAGRSPPRRSSRAASSGPAARPLRRDGRDRAARLARPGGAAGAGAAVRGLADAINITDGAGGNCHMSSVAAAAVLARRASSRCARWPAATATASRCRATCWAPRRWACATCCA